MGEAKLKLMKASKIVTFDFAGPVLHMSKAEIRSFSRGAEPEGLVDETRARQRAVWFTLSQIVGAAYPQGMDRHDGKLWSAWQESWDDDEMEESRVQVTWSQVEWLRKHAAKDELKTQPGLAQWREAVVDYLESIQVPSEIAEPVTGGER